MKKSTKDLMLGAATVAGATALGANAVHADTIQPAAPATEAVAQTRTTDTVADAQKDVNTKSEDLNAAQSNLTSASNAASSAKEAVNSASNAVANDQADVAAKSAAASSANALSDSVTSDKIKAASDAVAKDSTAVSTASSANEVAKHTASTARAAASQASSATNAQKTVVNTAQRAAKSAQDELDQATAHSKDVAAKSDAAQKADQAYQKALDADAAAKAKVQTAKDKLSDAVAQSAKTKKDLDNANADFTAKQKAQKEAQDALKAAQDHALDPSAQLQGTGIAVTATDAAKAVAQKLNNGVKFTSLTKDEQHDLLTGVTFSYMPNAADVVTKLGTADNQGQRWTLASMYRQLDDTNAISVNQFLALSLDAARFALGLHTGVVLVSPALQALSQGAYTARSRNDLMTASSVAGLDPNADNTLSLGQGEAGYPVRGMKDGHSVMGGRLDTEIAAGARINKGDYYTDYATDDAVSMANLKSELFYELNNVFSDADNYDSQLLATLLGANTAGTTDPTYIGYMPDSRTQDNIIAAANVNTIKDQETINESNAYPDVLPSKASEIDSLAKKAKAANDAFTASQAAQKTAQDAYNKAQSDQVAALKAANDAEADQANTASALTAAQSNKTAADKALADAQKTGADDPAKVTAAQSKLNQAQQAVKDAQKKLNDLISAQKTAETNLKAANEAAAKAQNALLAAQEALKTDQDKLTALQNVSQTAKNAAKALSDAQTKLKADKDALIKTQADAKVADANLATAQKLVDQDKAALEQATNHYNALKAIQQQKSEEEARNNDYHISGNHIVNQNGQQVHGWAYKGNQLVDPYGNVVSQVATLNSQATTLTSQATTSAPQMVAAKVANVAVNAQTAQSDGKLPQTGGTKDEATAAAGIGLSTLATMLGFAGSKKRRKYFN